MKYTFLFNQAGIVDAGLVDKTDFNDWAILEYVAEWQVHGSARMEQGHVWMNYKHLLAEMPMLSVRTKSGVSARVKRLKELGLLSAFQGEHNALFVKVTDFYCQVMRFRGETVKKEAINSVDSFVQGVHEDEQGVHEDEQGVHEDEHKINNNNKLSKQTKKIINKKEKLPDDDLSISEQMSFCHPEVDEELWRSFVQVRKKRKAAQSARALNAVLRELGLCVQGGIGAQVAIERFLESSWKGLKFEYFCNGWSYAGNRTNSGQNRHKTRREHAADIARGLDEIIAETFGGEVDSGHFR